MKRLTTILMMFVATVSTMTANDGVYFMSGNFLVPTKETDISVAKEILTITIGKDSIATVDVYYEFMNNGDAKTVTMAFEADAPYNAMFKFRRDGKHPCIKDFTVVMNDKPLAYQNNVIAKWFTDNGKITDYKPLDASKWKGYGEAPDDLVPMDDVIYNAELDSTTAFAYGYFFEAPFKHGLNKVHHTYSFLMSYRVGEKFEIPYWLTPATRWANRQVDDFTLRIKAEEPVKEFCMADTLFCAAPFKVTGGDGQIYQMTIPSTEHFIYVSLGPKAVLEWHATNFCPKEDMEIEDAERILNTHCNSGMVVIDAQGKEYRFIGDCGDTYFVSIQDYCTIPKAGCKVVEYDPFKGKGWVYPKNPGKFNVRKSPTTKSAIMTTVTYEQGMIPDAYRCLGQVRDKSKNSWYWWYKVNVNGKVGYIRTDLVEWDSINTF